MTRLLYLRDWKIGETIMKDLRPQLDPCAWITSRGEMKELCFCLATTLSASLLELLFRDGWNSRTQATVLPSKFYFWLKWTGVLYELILMGLLHQMNLRLRLNMEQLLANNDRKKYSRFSQITLYTLAILTDVSTLCFNLEEIISCERDIRLICYYYLSVYSEAAFFKPCG